ncbi:MAG TPA: TonB C-terminal domain-containing protein [Gemmatimonadaceae bacterium]|nr:TonB C-terminal domain-containing protein [Gemmatimonadaceae bacterium]
MRRGSSAPRLGLPIGASAVLHASLIALAILTRPGAPTALPPVYKVNLVAAPPGPRAIGQVARTPAPPTPTAATPPPKRAETNPRDMPAPAKPAPRKPAPPSTPTTETKPLPKDAAPVKAGGGPTGGSGTDVANIKFEGVEFPYPSYLNNIVRQIAVRFNPRNPGALRAEVFFIVKRDGTIGEFRFLTRSTSYAFNLEAQGAVESAGGAKAFGALPEGYVNDFLPVIFSFDPSLFR